MSWHVEDTLLERYGTGELDQARSASVEAHVIACADCRMRVARSVDAGRIERIWHEVQDTIQRPRRGFVEAFLVRCGVREYTARLVAATPSLTASWLVAVSLALGWSVVAARAGSRGVLLFLVVAPLIPLAGIALAFGPRIDPTYEVGVAAPMHGLRLLLLRAGCVLGATLALTGLASLALPQIGWMAAAWLLPALGVSLASMALATWLEPMLASGIVAFGWVSFTALSPLVRRSAPILDRILAFTPAGQVSFALLIGIAVAVLVVRGDRFDLGRQA